MTIRCEGDTDWRKLVTERGGDPDAELGYVGVDFSRRTGELRSLASFTELTGEAVCLPLKRFAVAADEADQVRGHAVQEVHRLRAEAACRGR